MGIERQIGSEFAGYRIDALLGQGGMGRVYRATKLRSGHPIAIKLLRPEVAADPVFSARFEREARLCAQLLHPHVVPMVEAGHCDGVLYLAMGYIDGVDLAAVIADQGTIHPRHVAPIVAQVASALDAAADLGLVHRDVKPSNVLIENQAGEAFAYLADFGVSKHMSSQSGITETGLWVGTVDYAAPEQLRSEKVDCRTDVYALGCVLYEALTGQVPFPRTRDVDKLIAHIADRPPRASGVAAGVPAAFDDVVARAMAKLPEQRFPSAGALADAASAAAKDAGPAPPHPLVTARMHSAAPVDRDAPTVG